MILKEHVFWWALCLIPRSKLFNGPEALPRTTDACMTARRSLFKDLPLANDTNFTPIYLDVMKCGYPCVHMSVCSVSGELSPNAEFMLTLERCVFRGCAQDSVRLCATLVRSVASITGPLLDSRRLRRS
jgi:hypothetical protein